MTLKSFSRYILLAGGFALSGAAICADPGSAPASASMLANTCAGCHGTGGVSVGPASPSLAGINQEYFVDVMKAFKSGDRHSTVMGRIAKGYTDQEVKAMGKYFAGKKFVANAQSVNKAKVAKGKRVHKKNCEKCHEKGGRVSEDGGILAGQWMPYLTYTMGDFTDGRSKMPKKMAKKVKKLTKDDIDALIHYYGSQK